MRTRAFFVEITLLGIAGGALLFLFAWRFGTHSYNYWPALSAAIAYWLLQGATHAHEHNTDLIGSTLILKRCSAFAYWLIPVGLAIGFF
jgi:hypothetical protein